MSDPVARFADRLRRVEAQFQRVEALRARLITGRYGPVPVAWLVAYRDRLARATAVWLTQPLPVTLRLEDNGLWCVAHLACEAWPPQQVTLTAADGWRQVAQYMADVPIGDVS